ncbi:hypothetical protein FE257_001538 [Aspergillus nanangensis]|uniref:Uncharacterized protein n=1 Tax=Aspergillus nanangensis TaxID=2582783 RepID=A0AAD4CTI8_ASPNN|nr:hypothetical protein FE257_001538 [Aspergillus nanangensis]
MNPMSTTTTPATPKTHSDEPPTFNDGDNTPNQRFQTVKKILLFILNQWLLIGMGVACVLAYYFPSVAKHGGTIRSEYTVLYGAMALIFLISGLSVPRQQLFLHMRNWRLHALVQVTSFLFVPAVMLVVVYAILAGDKAGKIDRAVLAGYIFTACIPTTIASNVVMTREAGGDDAAALVEVIIANVLGPFVTAAWTVTILPPGEEFEVWRKGGGDLTAMYKDVFRQLGLSVLLPLLVGQLVRWTWPEPTKRIVQRFKLPKLGSVCALQTLSAQSIAFVVCFNVALYIFLTAVCFVLCRPPRWLGDISPDKHRYVRSGAKHLFRRISPEETIAVCFCGPAKSTSLGIPLLYAMWTPLDLFIKAKTSIPVLLYTTEQICVAHLFVQLFRRWLERLEKQNIASLGVSPENGGGETSVEGEINESKDVAGNCPINGT